MSLFLKTKKTWLLPCLPFQKNAFFPLHTKKAAFSIKAASLTSGCMILHLTHSWEGHHNLIRGCELFEHLWPNNVIQCTHFGFSPEELSCPEKVPLAKRLIKVLWIMSIMLYPDNHFKTFSELVSVGTYLIKKPESFGNHRFFIFVHNYLSWLWNGSSGLVCVALFSKKLKY